MILSYFKKNFSKKSSIDFKKMVASGAVIIDLRPSREFETGHIKDSQNIPLILIGQSLTALKKLGKPIIVVGVTGQKSNWATTILAETGVEVYNGGSWLGLKQVLQVAQ